jgi:hypothetical protein
MASIINAATSGGLISTGDTSGQLQLQTGGTTALTVDSTQNVGVGITSPSGIGRLVVKAAGTSSVQGFAVQASGNDSFLTIYNNASVHTFEATYSSTGSYQPIAFITNSLERMRITTAGNVGIGTTSPSYKLVAIDGTNSKQQIVFSDNATYFGSISHNSGTGQNEYRTEASGAHGWFIGTSSTTANMTLDSSGNLLVGTTTLTGGKINAVNSSGLWIQKLQDAASNGSMIQFLTPAGSQAGSITISGSTTSYGSGSDYRLKEQIKPLENALSKVNQLKPVSWVWKTEQTNGQGFIAHELAEIVPHCVIGEKDAIDENGDIKPQMVDTSFLVATLTSAIQELSTQLTELKAEVATLRGA